jgi:hypothetical protein
MLGLSKPAAPPAAPPPPAAAAPVAAVPVVPPPKPAKEFRCCNVCPYETVQKAQVALAASNPSLLQLNLKAKVKTKVKAKGTTVLKSQTKRAPPGFDAVYSLPPCCDFCRQIYFPKTPEAPTLDFPDPPTSLDEIRERRSKRPSRQWRILEREKQLKAREASFIETSVDVSVGDQRTRVHHRSSSSSEDTPDLLGGLGSVGGNLMGNLQNVGTNAVSDLQAVGQNLVDDVVNGDDVSSSGGGDLSSSTGDGDTGGTGVGFAANDDPFPPDSDACCHRCAKRDATTEGIQFWGST